MARLRQSESIHTSCVQLRFQSWGLVRTQGVEWRKSTEMHGGLAEPDKIWWMLVVLHYTCRSWLHLIRISRGLIKDNVVVRKGRAKKITSWLLLCTLHTIVCIIHTNQWTDGKLKTKLQLLNTTLGDTNILSHQITSWKLRSSLLSVWRPLVIYVCIVFQHINTCLIDILRDFIPKYP